MKIVEHTESPISMEDIVRLVYAGKKVEYVFISLQRNPIEISLGLSIIPGQVRPA